MLCTACDQRRTLELSVGPLPISASDPLLPCLGLRRAEQAGLRQGGRKQTGYNRLSSWWPGRLGSSKGHGH